jgi:peptidyl-prolyl cis-trans isomerase C
MCAGNVYAEELNPVVGKTGDFILREADLDRLISYQTPEIQKSIQDNTDQKSNLIRQMLLTKAIAGKARKDNFDKKPEEKEILSYMVDQYLAQEYLTKVVEATNTPTDENMKKYYAEHENNFLVPETVKARHIFISAPKDSAADLKNKAKAKAEELLQKIRSGGDFIKIATENSEDTETASKGGDLGYISAGKTNSQEFESAVFSLKTAEVSPVVETPFGFHIILIDERREKRTATFDEAKGYIQAQLKEQEKQKKTRIFLDALAKETGLEVIGEKGTQSK